MRNTVARLLCALLLVAVIPGVALAEGGEVYRLEALDMSLSIPEGYAVFTRDTAEDDPNLALYGLTPESLLSMMESRSIYLNALNESCAQEIVVTMTEIDTDDFSSLSDGMLAIVASAMEKQYQEVGITYLGSEIYEGVQAKFMKIYISQPNGDVTVYGLQYYTVVDGKAINITMQSYSGPIGEVEEAELKGIVDGATFGPEQ